MFDGKKIICIAPCYNELHKIDKVVARIRATAVVDEILVVDGGSTDGSPETARALGASILSIGRAQGVGVALRAGIEYGIAGGFDIIVIIAGNNKDEPQEIVRLVSPLSGMGMILSRARALRRVDATEKCLCIGVWQQKSTRCSFPSLSGNG